MMDDLVTELRNKTQMSRFGRCEVLAILEFLKDGGYLKLVEPVEIKDTDDASHE